MQQQQPMSQLAIDQGSEPELNIPNQSTAKTDPLVENRRNFFLKQTLFWFYHLFIMALALVFVVYMVKTKRAVESIQTLPEYQRAMESIQFWNKGYVVDIKGVSAMNCPQGYEPLIEHQWDGTVEGCACPAILGGIYNYEFILKGMCSADLIENGCYRVPSLDAQPMQFWKGSKLLCARRIKSLNFYNSTYPNLKTCAAGKPYQVETYINVSCPLTNVSNSSLTGGQTLTLDDSNMLSFLNSAGYPIASFKLTEYEFCPTFNQSNISPNKMGTYILQYQNLTTCNGTDPRVTAMDSTDEQTLINNNYIVKQSIGALPAFPRPSNVYVYKLGYVSYPAWSYKCRTSNDLNLVAATSHFYLQKETSVSQILVTTTVIFSVLFGVVIRFFYLGRRVKELRSKNEFSRIFEDERELAKKIPNLNFIHNTKNQICLFLLDFLLACALFGMLVYGVFHFSNHSLWFKSVYASECTDTFMVKVMRQYEKRIDEGYYNIVLCLVLCILVLLFDLIYLLFRFKGGDLRAKQSVMNSAEVDDNNRQMVPDDMGKSEKGMFDKDVKDLEIEDIKDDKIDRETKDGFGIYNMDGDLGVKKKKKKKAIRSRDLFKKDNKKDSSNKFQGDDETF